MDMTDEERSVIDSVLIDTWWNVNDVAKNVILISFQF